MGSDALVATVAMGRGIGVIDAEALSSLLRRAIAQNDTDYEQREIVS